MQRNSRLRVAVLAGDAKGCEITACMVAFVRGTARCVHYFSVPKTLAAVLCRIVLSPCSQSSPYYAALR